MTHREGSDTPLARISTYFHITFLPGRYSQALSPHKSNYFSSILICAARQSRHNDNILINYSSEGKTAQNTPSKLSYHTLLHGPQYLSTAQYSKTKLTTLSQQPTTNAPDYKLQHSTLYISHQSPQYSKNFKIQAIPAKNLVFPRFSTLFPRFYKRISKKNLSLTSTFECVRWPVLLREEPLLDPRECRSCSSPVLPHSYFPADALLEVGQAAALPSAG